MPEAYLKTSDAYLNFARAAAAKTLSHAYLVLGEDAALVTLMQTLMAEAVLCAQGGCGSCPTCEKIAARAHSDFKVFNEDGKMKVADAEMLISDAYIRALESNTKLFFVEHAELLTPQVQNKLLKIYEEPPRGVVLVLFAANEAGILHTIRSRAKKITLPALAPAAVCEILVRQGVPRETAEAASVFSGGRLDRASRYAEQEEYADLYASAFRILLECKRSSDIAAHLNDAAFSKENIGDTLEFMEIILRDVLEHAAGGHTYITIDKDYAVETIAAGFTGGGAAMAILALNTARMRLKANMSATTVAEAALFEILEAKYKWQS